MCHVPNQIKIIGRRKINSIKYHFDMMYRPYHVAYVRRIYRAVPYQHEKYGDDTIYQTMQGGQNAFTRYDASKFDLLT